MAGLQEQIDALVRSVASNRARIDELKVRATAAEARADQAEARADEAERRSEIDRDMIAELQRDGVLSQAHAGQMEDALRSSRNVGAAIGLIMASRQLSETEAFEVIRRASQNSNRKVRDLAAEIVLSAERGEISA